MAVEVKMPQLGESVHEGMIGKWLKAEGEQVEQYEPLLEVVTDKVDTEVTASESGTLLRILVPEGDTVAVGTPLAVIGAPGEAVAAGPTADGEPGDREAKRSRVSPVAARVAADHGIDPTAVEGSGRGGQVTRADIERTVESRAEKAATPVIVSDDIGFISPRVARLAATHGVDLRRVQGTGRDGRITARDVESFAATAATAPTKTAAEDGAEQRAGPSTAKPATRPISGADDAASFLGEVMPLTRMRKAIADHMVQSIRTSPHVATVHEVDMSAVMAALHSQREEFADRGVRLTLTAVIVDAVSRALRQHPLVNSSWTDAGVRIHRAINIGLAVAIDEGLIVPVIHDADDKNLLGLAREVGDLAERARSKKLLPDDVQGGTFTISNYGTLGSLFGTPVINQPQAAILGTGAIKKRVVVVEGPDGSDQIAIRPMMYLALTFDHRILDGGTADPFMQTLVRTLEQYEA